MRKDHALAVLAAAVLLCGLLTWIGADAARKGVTGHPSQMEVRSHTEWVAASMMEMGRIRPGMSRGDLLKVFTTEGGICTQYQRTYVYRDCPYFKVNVTFKRPAGGKAITADPDNPRDIIEAVSQPYLEFTISD